MRLSSLLSPLMLALAVCSSGRYGLACVYKRSCRLEESLCWRL